MTTTESQSDAQLAELPVVHAAARFSFKHELIHLPLIKNSFYLNKIISEISLYYIVSLRSFSTSLLMKMITMNQVITAEIVR